jgi:hypothetical protein
MTVDAFSGDSCFVVDIKGGQRWKLNTPRQWKEINGHFREVDASLHTSDSSPLTVKMKTESLMLACSGILLVVRG